MAMGPGRRQGLIRLASRGSPLALWQAARVAALIDAAAGAATGATGEAAGPSVCEVVVIETTGDRLKDVPVGQLAGQGAFVVEIQRAVLEGRADIAVHSAKDLPSVTPDGLVLACVPERADPATPWWGRGWPISRPGRGLPRDRPGGGPSWLGCGPTSPSSSCGATWPPGSSGPDGRGPGWWPWPLSSGWA